MFRFFVFTLFFFLLFSCNRSPEVYQPIHAPFLQADTRWADSVLVQLTLEQKIGQLLLWSPPAGLGMEAQQLYNHIGTGKITGLLLQDLPVDSFLFTLDTCRRLAPLPLLIGTDQDVVINNQFSDAVTYPLPATLSSLGRDSLIEELEDLLATQCETLGINFCIGPSLNQVHPGDLCYNFGCFVHDREPLLRHSTRVLQKLQQRNILAVAHDFNDIIYLKADTTQVLDSILQPFFNLSYNGLSGLLSGAAVFTEDSSMFRSLDYLGEYCMKNLEFGGLHVARANNGKEIERQFLAGVDLFLVKDSLDNYAKRLQSLVENGFLSERMLNNKVHKILRAKAWTEQQKNTEPEARATLATHLVDPYEQLRVRQLYEASMVLAQNFDEMLPFGDIAARRFKVVQIGEQKLTGFLNDFDRYASQINYHYPPSDTGAIAALDARLFSDNTIILTLDGVDISPKKHAAFIASVNALCQQTEVALINFGNPLNLQYFDTTMAMVQLFERNPLTESFAAQLLFGGMSAKGHLPLAVAPHLPYGRGISTPVTRLQYSIPEAVGIAAYKLVGIDAIARSAIDKGTMPGCQVMVIKNGKVIYDKSFGTLGNDKKSPVKSSDIYDIASVTKVASTTMAVMKLYETGKVKLKDPLASHLEMPEKSPLRKISIQQLLTHESGLRSYMPINSYVMARDDNSTDCSKYFCKENTPPFTVPVANHFFMDYHYVDTIWQEVYNIKLNRRKRYLYSDVNFALLQKVVEEEMKTGLDVYVKNQFYDPLNMRRTGFRPFERFALSEIAPTANDEKWRKQLVRGYVHDESAALLGGVGGNAGLFSNASDLAVLFQTLLNGGTYGGRRFLQESTIKTFTATQYKSRRGLGFDKNSARGNKACSPRASSATYGHTGFTGACVWVDPQEELIFIFLTNRINPSTRNKRIFRDKIRSRMHTVVYDALDSYDDEALPRPGTREMKEMRAEASLVRGGEEEEEVGFFE